MTAGEAGRGESDMNTDADAQFTAFTAFDGHAVHAATVAHQDN